MQRFGLLTVFLMIQADMLVVPAQSQGEPITIREVEEQQAAVRMQMERDGIKPSVVGYIEAVSVILVTHEICGERYATMEKYRQFVSIVAEQNNLPEPVIIDKSVRIAFPLMKYLDKNTRDTLKFCADIKTTILPD